MEIVLIFKEIMIVFWGKINFLTKNVSYQGENAL
jgi:hypothetical protein